MENQIAADTTASDATQAKTPDCPLTTAQVLWQERFELREPARARRDEHMALDEAEFRRTASDANMSALCLSGGGIRSASFSLGVVQALAAKNLLTGFDYLSTVSGGGYLGSFLQRWILASADDGRNEAEVERQLARSVTGETVPEITQLREGANFITPKLGLMSGDTWTAIATSLRNISVNWTLFVPMILIVAAVPPLFYWLLMEAGVWTARIALALHWIAATWAMTGVFLGLPSNRPKGYWSVAQVRGHILLPAAFAMVTMLVIVAAPSPNLWWRDWWLDLLPGWGGNSGSEKRQILFAAMGFVGVPLISFLVAQVIAGRAVGRRLFYDLLLWMVCGLVGAAFLYAVAAAAINQGLIHQLTPAELGDAKDAVKSGIVFWPVRFRGAELLVTFGPAIYVGSLLAVGWTFSVLRTALRHRAPRDEQDALRQEADAVPDKTGLRPDLDREWLVRISGELIRPVLLWSLLALVCLILTYFDLATRTINLGGKSVLLDSWEGQLGLLAGAISSGLAGALAGKSSGSWVGYVTKFLSLEVLASIATVVFAVVALLVAAHAISDLAVFADGYWGGGKLGPDGRARLMLFGHFALIAGLVLFLWFWGQFVDVNRFSLHGFYRNRLARAFLGAARVGKEKVPTGCDAHVRRPDPFTGIDPADNIRLHSLWPQAPDGGERCLFPVINVALNAVATKKLSWQERKALPFVMTPLASGSGWLSQGESCEAVGAYIESKRFGGSERDEALKGAGVTLAAAMAISGAAASPNMGYHSSPATAFLMTLFNVRLGAWMPNPALWKRDDPNNPAERRRNGVMPLLRELGGNTSEDSADVYLSDGGHFENLGLYEMLRRRCASIFVVDAGCDPDLTFEDLSNAARKAAIDLNVTLKFDKIKLASRAVPHAGSIAYSVADIEYPEDWKGQLIYLKPSLTDPLPIDVRSYAAGSKTFPHETTADQWYTESQFESYRSLGATLCGALGEPSYLKTKRGRAMKPAERIAQFFRDVEAEHEKAPDCAN